MSNQKPHLVVIAGPTASGKTALSVLLAQALSGEVVSADSMQVYDGIRIATACPTEEERKGVEHHLLEHVALSETYSVARYSNEARTVIDGILARRKTPIMCGGTGLYIAAVTDNVRYEDHNDSNVLAIRSRLQQELHEFGEQAMWEKLHSVDPDLADKLHIRDCGRILRGLEVFMSMGITMTELQRRQRSQPSPYCVTMITLDFRDRALLYERIDRRVDVMVENGLLEETAKIVRCECPTAMQAIGCKELRPYFDGECSLKEALDNMKRRSRQYAKRQLSWFRRIETAHTLYVDDYESADELLSAALDLIYSEKGEREDG